LLKIQHIDDRIQIESLTNDGPQRSRNRCRYYYFYNFDRFLDVK